jgi:tetratricopeptide (TPR) repeat protein
LLRQVGAPGAAAPVVPALAKDAPPRPARFYYELGLTCAALGELESAIAALRRATALEPSMGAAWSALGDLLTRTRDEDGAKAAYEQARGFAEETKPEPPAKIPSGKLESELRAWVKRVSENPPALSGPMLREHLRREPTDVGALRVLAEIGAKHGLLAAAQRLLERALMLAPHHPPLRFDYAKTLAEQGSNRRALEILESLAAEQRDNLNVQALLAVCLANMGEYERALPLYERVLSKTPTANTDTVINYAYALRYAGRREDSARVCRQCIAGAPGTGRAWWSLADLKTEKFTDADLRVMLAQVRDSQLPAVERYNLHYAIGHALEQAGDYEDSFRHYAAGAALKRAELHYNADQNTREMQRHAAFFTESRLAEGAAHGHADTAPIFVVGLPRVGSTLIEQILASHSAVEGTQELFDIPDIANDIGMCTGLGAFSLYPERIGSLRPDEIAAFGERYIERTRRFRRTGRPFFIDKMPGNWVYLGLIHTLLPNAKIIDARRHPMATGFSAFKQLFVGGANYSYDLTEIGRYYNDYLMTMAHFDRVLPGRVHRVVYESLVTDTETEIRRLLEYCGLTFEPACLRFWETKRAVATPSGEQVRQPISRAAKDQWRNYEPWLGPLRTALDGPGA